MKKMMLCAFFAALTAVLSQVMVPIGPVPINLALVSVFIAGGLLGWKLGMVSQAIFVLMGAIGLPVFVGFKGGIGTVLGPTGGFLLGYILCSLIVGIISEKYGSNYKLLAIGMIFGLTVTYILGISWFTYITHSDILTSLTTCVFPFLIGDFAKIAVSTMAVKKLETFTYRRIKNEC